jgi:hypothetical protein
LQVFGCMHEEPTSQKHKRQNTLTLLTSGHERDVYFSNSAERHYLPQGSTANTLTPSHHGIFYQYFKMYGVLYNIITCPTGNLARERNFAREKLTVPFAR